MKPFRLGIAGLGTVGAGVVKIVQEHGDMLAARAGRPIEIVSVNARNKSKDRGVDISAYRWIDNASDLADSNSIDAVLEMIGGEDGPALDLARQALSKGIHVITANKAMLAHHGLELAQVAEQNNAAIGYEAAVAGGIPIIKSMREGFAANQINAIYGILNGTCNYILTEMRETGRDFSDVLKDAQELGYAESDPTFDVEGVDAAHKLCLLASIAFGTKPDFDSLKVKGVSDISATDIAYAQELGYRIKLLGIARRYEDGVMQMMEPCLVPENSTLGGVEGVYNAVLVEGDFVDTGLAVGRGAGEGPTASSVMADVIDLARGFNVPTFGVPASHLKNPVWMDRGAVCGHYYVRFTVLDKPGVLADISALLRDHNISIESFLQRSRDPGQAVPLVMTLHDAAHQDVLAACDAVFALDSVTGKPCFMRIESL